MANELYVLNKGVAAPSSFSSAPTTNIQYDASVNPRLQTINLAGTGPSINCYEIYNTSASSLSTTVTSSILNRLYPVNTTIESYLETASTSAGYFIHSNTTLSNIVSGSGLDTTNDYFVVIHADDAMQHHIAKITAVKTYQTIGDGFEFTPKLKEDIPKGTKFTIYKGPPPNNTTIVAVGYGLMGDTATSSSTVNANDDRHGDYAEVSRPTFYFYDNKLTGDNNKKQLDNLTKYTIVRGHYASGATSVSATSSVFVTTEDFGYVIQDKSRFKQYVTLTDNLRNNDKSCSGTVNGHAKFAGGNTNYTFDHDDWDEAMRNAGRQVFAGTGSTLHTNVRTGANFDYTGPSRYVKYISSPEKTRILSNIMNTTVYTGITKSGNFAESTLIDTNKIMHEKLNPDENYTVRTIIADEDMTGRADAQLPGLWSSNPSGSHMTVTGLKDGEDLRQLLTLGTDHEIIRIGKYYYATNGCGAPANGSQTVNISSSRLDPAVKFTVGTTTHEFSEKPAYRKAWSTIIGNLMTNLNIDTTYDGSTLKRNGSTIEAAESDINGISFIIRDKEYNGNRLTVSYGDDKNKFLVVSDADKDLYSIQTTGSGIYSTGGQDNAKYMDYFSGNAVIDRTIFNGKIEYLEDSIENGQMKYKISGRDNLSELLGSIVNKKYLYSNEYVYSTLSPVNHMIDTGLLMPSSTVSDGTVSGSSFKSPIGTFEFDNTDSTGTMIKWESGGAGTTVLYVGDRLFCKDGNNKYYYLGKIQAAKTSNGGGAVLPDATSDTVSGTFYIEEKIGYEYHSYFNSSNNDIGREIYVAREMIVAGKSLETNILDSTRQTSLKGAGDKGVNFLSGQEINVNTGATVELLNGTKAIDNNESLGFPIANIHEDDSDKKSAIGFSLMDGTETNVVGKHTVSSMTEYEVVDVANINDVNTISIAPIMPTVLGRIDYNSSDTRFTNTQGLYLLNTNGLPNGGFLHLLNSEKSDNRPVSFLGRIDDVPETTGSWTNNYPLRFGNFLWRYVDLQKCDHQELYHHDNVKDRFDNTVASAFGVKPLDIYRKHKGRIIGYTGVTRIDHAGNAYTTTYDTDYSTSYQMDGSPEKRGILPAMGSLFDDLTLMPTHYYTSDFNSGKRRLPALSSGYDRIELAKLQFEAFDPKALSWFIFSIGDIKPDSMAQPNHIGYNSSSVFTDYSLILKNKGNKNTGSSHQKYKGNALSTTRVDASYETIPIETASITPSNMKRFGLIRLIETTVDWHFNNVDAENITDNGYKKLNNAEELFSHHNRVWAADEWVNTNQFQLHSAAITTTGSHVQTGSNTVAVNAVGKLYGVAGSVANRAETITATGVTSISVTTGGSGYTAASGVATTGGSGSGLTVNTTVSAGAITGVAIANATTNYQVGDIVTVAGGSGGTLTITGVKQIHCSGATFQTDGAIAGMFVQGTQTSLGGNASWMTIASVDSETQITLNEDRGLASSGGIGLWANVLYTDPYADTTGRAREIGTIQSIAGTTITLQANASFDYNGEIYYAPGKGDATNDWTNAIQDFNKHMITGPRHTTWKMLRKDSTSAGVVSYGTAGRRFNGLSDNKLMFPAVFGESTYNSAQFSLNSYGNNPHAFWSWDKHTNTMSSHSRVLRDMCSRDDSTQTNGSILRVGMLGVITKGYEPWVINGLGGSTYWAYRLSALEGHTNHTLDSDGYVANTNAFLGSGYHARFSSGNSSKANCSAYIGYPAYSDPKTDSASRGPATQDETRTITDKVMSTYAWYSFADEGPVGKDLGYPIYPNHDKGGTAYNYNVRLLEDCEILTGRERTPIMAKEGMTFHLNYNDWVGGNREYQYAFQNYSASYNGEKQIYGQYEGGVTMSARLNQAKNGEINSFMGYDPVNDLDTHDGYNLIDDNQTGAEVLYKPTLWPDGSDVTITGVERKSIDDSKRAMIVIEVTGRTTGYTGNSDSATWGNADNLVSTSGGVGYVHRWINYVPNLTGQYLVSGVGEKFDNSSGVNDATSEHFQDIQEMVPDKIHYIVSHTIEKTGNASHPERVKHFIEIDNVAFSGSTPQLAKQYRVMRIAENCFYDFSPKEIDLCTLSKRYTKIARKDACYEDVDSFNTFTKPDGFSSKNSTWNEAILSMYLPVEVDGRSGDNFLVNRSAAALFTTNGANNTFANGSSYDMFVTDGHDNFRTSMSVDFQTGSRVGAQATLNFSNLKRISGLASLGNIFTITTFRKPSIESNRACIGTAFNVVNEVEDIINEELENNNIVYTKSNDTNRYYEAFNLQGANLYNAANAILGYKDRKLLVDGSDIKVVKNIDDIDYTDIRISDGNTDIDIVNINKNVSLFDTYNEITVYGDGVKSTMRDSATIRKTGKTTSLEEVDFSIITEKAAEKRARKLLDLHTTNSVAVSFKSSMKGMEYLKPGQLITMDYPSEHIPIDTYQVLGITYSMGDLNEVLIGKYNANLTQRIAELSSANRKIEGRLRGDRFSTPATSNWNYTPVNIKTTKLIIYRTGVTSTIGFGMSIGFNNVIGLTELTGDRNIVVEEDLT